MFIHILLGIEKNTKTDTYIRVLGFNKTGQNYLKSLDINYNNYKNTYIYNTELNAAVIYDLINNTNTYSYEIKNKPIKY